MTSDSLRAKLAQRLRRRPTLLYPLLDDSLLEPTEFVTETAALIDGGAELLQFRAKRLDDRTALGLIEAILRVARPSGVPLLVNDRCDLAMLSDADGVHLGAEDLPPARARALLGPDRIVGATAHDQGELVALDPAVVDYVGYGAVFATGTRVGATICGPEALTGAVAATSLPVVAIGGISPDNVQSLRGTGVSAIAVASSVSPSRARPGAVRELVDALREW